MTVLYVLYLTCISIIYLCGSTHAGTLKCPLYHHTNVTMIMLVVAGVLLSVSAGELAASSDCSYVIQCWDYR